MIDQSWLQPKSPTEVEVILAQLRSWLEEVRHPNNAIENLVAAHERCNRNKRDFLADHDHVERWRSRLDPSSAAAADLRALAEVVRWESEADRSVRVARGIYLHLPAHVPLWIRGREFGALDPNRMAALLS